MEELRRRMGILAAAWTASVWKRAPEDSAISEAAVMGWMTPVSLLAIMSVTMAVRPGRMAWRSSSRSMVPSGRVVSEVISMPSEAWRDLRQLVTASCSAEQVTK